MGKFGCKEKYEVYPIYLAKNGEMYWGDSTGLLEAYTGGNLPLLLKRSFRVTLMRRDGQVFLYALHGRRFFRKPVTALDVALPIVHGTNAEDGTLQGYLQTLGLPYAGCDVTSSALGMMTLRRGVSNCSLTSMSSSFMTLRHSSSLVRISL